MRSTLRPRLRAAARALLAVAPSALAAQAPDSTARDSVARRLPAVEVLGSVIPLASPEVGSGVPARGSVLSREELAPWGHRLLADAIASQAGVSLYDDLGSSFKPTLVARGFAASPVVGLPQGISVFVDGVPVNEADAGQVNFDLLPLEHVRHVEVLRGTASLLGPYSLGGAVNLVTRRGEGEPGGEIELSGGSHGRRSVSGSAGGDARGWSWYAGAGHEREDGWRQLTGAARRDGFVKLARLGPRAGLSVSAFAARSRAETAGSLPLSVYRERPDSNLSAGDFEDLEQLHVAAAGYVPLARGRLSLSLYARAHEAERFNVNQEADPDVRAFSRNRTLGARADWSLTRRAGRGVLGLRVGGGGQANRTNIRLFAERIDPGLTTDVSSPIGRVDAFALGDFRLGRVTLSGGARHDVVRVPFRNRLDPARDTVSTYRRLSPRGGVTVTIGKGASLYASAGQSFRSPAVIELACADPEEPCPLPFALGDDPPLAPVVATTGEIGGRWARGLLFVDASAYRTDVRDDIFLHPYREENEPEGSTIDGFFANVPRTRREGIEVESQLLLAAGHRVRASYALTRATFQSRAELFSVREAAGESNEVTPGRRMPLVPAHSAAVGVVARLPAGLEAAADARYTGERWLRGDEANTTSPLPGHWTADARVGWAAGPWSLQLVARNLFDTRYASFGTFNVNQGAGDVLERFLTPGAPRTLHLTLRRTIGTGD